MPLGPTATTGPDVAVIKVDIGYEQKVPKWNKIDIFDVVLNVVVDVDVGMYICVSVSGLMGGLIGNCTFLVELFYFITI